MVYSAENNQDPVDYSAAGFDSLRHPGDKYIAVILSGMHLSIMFGVFS